MRIYSCMHICCGFEEERLPRIDQPGETTRSQLAPISPEASTLLLPLCSGYLPICQNMSLVCGVFPQVLHGWVGAPSPGVPCLLFLLFLCA